MTVLNVITVPNPILNQETSRIQKFDNKLKTLISDMFETMHEFNGVGLAGPQIGLLEKICVIEHEKTKYTLINPEITEHSGSEVMEEGCLSIPETLVPVDRPTHIYVKAQDVKGKIIEFRESGFLARIIQHEIDHLNGVLITDKIPFDINTVTT